VSALGIDDLSVDRGGACRQDVTQPEHLARHPLVPVIEDEEGTLYESGALCLHIADSHAAAGLIATAGSSARAAIYQWAFFAMTEVEPPLIDHYLAGDYLAGGTFSVGDVIVGDVVRDAVLVVRCSRPRPPTRTWPASMLAWHRSGRSRRSHERIRRRRRPARLRRAGGQLERQGHRGVAPREDARAARGGLG
jgi:glutathione S-transferase